MITKPSAFKWKKLFFSSPCHFKTVKEFQTGLIASAACSTCFRVFLKGKYKSPCILQPIQVCVEGWFLAALLHLPLAPQVLHLLLALQYTWGANFFSAQIFYQCPRYNKWNMKGWALRKQRTNIHSEVTLPVREKIREEKGEKMSRRGGWRRGGVVVLGKAEPE